MSETGNKGNVVDVTKRIEQKKPYDQNKHGGPPTSKGPESSRRNFLKAGLTGASLMAVGDRLPGWIDAFNDARQSRNPYLKEAVKSVEPGQTTNTLGRVDISVTEGQEAVKIRNAPFTQPDSANPNDQDLEDSKILETIEPGQSASFLNVIRVQGQDVDPVNNDGTTWGMFIHDGEPRFFSMSKQTAASVKYDKSLANQVDVTTMGFSADGKTMLGQTNKGAVVPLGVRLASQSPAQPK